MNDFEDDYGDVEYKAEADAYERTGPGGKLAEMVSGAMLGDMQKSLAREAISPEDRFLIFTDAIARRINADHIATVSEADITILLEKTVQIPGLRYKNPVAYIMGFLASKGGQKLERETVLYVIDHILPRMGDEGGVTAPDVIRYARYWHKFL